MFTYFSSSDTKLEGRANTGLQILPELVQWWHFHICSLKLDVGTVGDNGNLYIDRQKT